MIALKPTHCIDGRDRWFQLGTTIHKLLKMLRFLKWTKVGNCLALIHIKINLRHNPRSWSPSAKTYPPKTSFAGRGKNPGLQLARAKLFCFEIANVTFSNQLDTTQNEEDCEI